MFLVWNLTADDMPTMCRWYESETSGKISPGMSGSMHVIHMSSRSVYVICTGQQLCIKPTGFLVIVYFTWYSDLYAALHTQASCRHAVTVTVFVPFKNRFMMLWFYDVASITGSIFLLHYFINQVNSPKNGLQPIKCKQLTTVCKEYFVSLFEEM